MRTFAEKAARETFNERASGDLSDEYPIELQELSLPEFAWCFPDVAFFRAEGRYKLPPGYALIAARDEKAYILPKQFNRLLADAGVVVNDATAFAVGEVFVLTTMPEVLDHAVVFSDEQRIEEIVERYGFVYRYKVTAWSEANGILTEWRLAPQDGQLRVAESRVLDVGVGDYVVDVEGPAPEKGAATMYYPDLAN